MPRVLAFIVLLTFQASHGITRGAVRFSADIAPILAENCLTCHGAKKAKGGYRVDTYRQILKAGDSDLPAVTPSDRENSEIWHRITTGDSDDRMPQDAAPLSPDQIRVVERWIEEGAAYDADDPDASLASIMPPPTYPAPPETYPQSVPVSALASSADGTGLFVSGYHEITVWNPDTQSLTRRIQQQSQRTYAIAVHPAGTHLAAAGGLPGRLGELRLFGLQDGTLQRVLLAATDVVLDAAFSPDGTRLAAGTAEGKIHLFNTSDWAQTHVLASHSDWVTALAWNKEGTRFASASRDKSAKVYDAASGERIITYTGHEEPVYGVLFHPDGEQVYSGGGDRRLHIWTVENGKKLKEIGTFEGDVYKLVAHHDSFFVVSSDQRAVQFSFADHKWVRDFEGHADWVLASTVLGSQNRLATGSFDGEVRIWNLDDGNLLHSFAAHP